MQGVGDEPVQAEGRQVVQIPDRKETGAEGRGAGEVTGERLEGN